MPGEANHPFWRVPIHKWTVKKTFVGDWRVVQLQGFDDDYLDLCGPASMRISTRGTANMNFGAVALELDCKVDDFDIRILHFSFEGPDDGDPICGRGYCVVEADKMTGRIFRHYGDVFDFRARKVQKA